MSAPLKHVSILIPACDEEELLPRCLRSIERARLQLEAGISSDVVVISDASEDGTASIAATLLGGGGTVASIDARCVGAARAAAATLARARFGGHSSSHWLASTDADCEVPGDWLQRQLEHAAQGWTAVAGIIAVDSFHEHEPEVAERFRLTYALHADGTHPHVHGANLGVRADVYLQAGGWAPLESAEDHDLWTRLGRIDSRRLSDASLRVLTSGRRKGRAPRGFADALAAHNLDVAC